MKKLRIFLTLFGILQVFALAFGQEMPAAKTHAGRLGPFARYATQSAVVSEQPLTSTAPHWNSGFNFTPDTALTGHWSVYDPATNVMIVFGGLDWGAEETLTNAVLLQNNANGLGGSTTWTTLIGNGMPGSPAARGGHRAVYDSANNRMIVFGGCDGIVPIGGACTDLLNDVWVLTNANGQGGTPAWIQLTPSGSSPAPRFGYVAAYDAANNRMIIFGGGTMTQAFTDAWVLSNANGLRGTPAWTQLSPSGLPPQDTVEATGVYDPTNNILTVFGGSNGAEDVYTNGVWTLSHANGMGGTPQWTNIVADGSPGSPSKRSAHAAIYDASSNRMTIFGGSSFAADGLNDVWVLTNANGLGGTPTWSRLKPTGLKPGPRFFPTAVFDATNNRMMVFAGANGDALYLVTWVLSHANGL